MSAPTLAEIVEAAAEATWDANCPPNAARWDAQGAGLHHEWHETIRPAVTATLAALEPLASTWSLSAWKHANLGDLAAERGDMTSAEREWARRDTYAENAKQLRAIIAATGEKS